EETTVADAQVIHFGKQPEVLNAESIGANVSFETSSFSVYGVVYTVDFSYEVDGKVYRFSMPGGGFVSLTDLVEVLGIIGDTNSDENAAESAEIAKENAVNEGAEESGVNSETNTALTLGDVEVSDDTRKFVSDMESVEFSNPELVDISKVEAYTTVGQIKESRGLDVEYSAELTEEKIAEINGTVVESGDWALISVHPFDTEETLTVTMKDGEVFTIKVTDAQYINGATVHYGYMEGNTFHEFTSEQFTPPTSGFGTPAYLIYDVPGYQYAGTTYHDYETTNPYWPWESVKHHDEVPPIIEFQNATGDYYVCYEPRPTATQGGTSSIQEDYPQEPTVLKKSAENPNTGTNTISLEVSGPQKTAKAKADIIVIYDVSGSMRFPIGFNSLTDVQPGEDAGKYIVPDTDPSQRNYIVKRAIQKLASELMGEQTAADPAVRMGIVPFSTSAGTIVPFTGSADTFNRAVGSLALGGGTNWEDALQAANAMSVREDADTYVIFVTDGNPTFRISRQGATDSQITSVDNKSGVTRDYYDQLGIFGTGNADADKSSTDSLNRNYDAALAIAKAIVGSSKNLYGIGISEEAKKLENLINESGTGGNYYEVTTQGGIEPAIEDIKNQIKEKTFGYSDVQISDGITALTQTVQKTGMTNLPDSDDFEYFKGHAATQEDVDAGKAAKVGDTVWETWTAEQMAKEGAGRAAYNSDTGAVEWNLGETFMLEEGVSYKVDFTVWPSQEAYDLLADLNNGLKDYDTLDQSVRAQIKKNGTGENATYTLKTNRDDETGNPAGYTYKKATKEGEDGDVTPTGDPIPGTFDPVIPLKLRTDKIGVEKSFSNLLDSRDPTQIQLELWGNRLYKTFTLTKDGQWKSDDNYISCGLLTVDKETDKLYVYETGHDFTLKETGEDSIYWELTADTYHPMVINDVLHMLSKVDAPVGMSADTKYYCADDGKEYYRVEGNVYRDEGTDAVLKAVNDHRSFLDLSKEVIGDGDEPVASDDLFTFEAQFNESRTDDDIIFTVYDTVSKEYISDVSITTATLTPADDATNTRPYYVAKNNTKFTLKIKQGWNVRFLNLSNATTYTIKEVLEDTEYVFIKIEGDAKKTGTDHNSASVNTHMTITLGNTEMSGTIEEANVLYSVKYTNKAPKKKIQILKTDQSGSTPLKGAEFSLYGSDHYDEEGNVNPEAQALESNKATDQNGILDLGQYTWGTYYLVEEKAPEGYIKLDKPIKIVLSASPAYEQSESSLSTSGNGITPLQDEGQRVMGYQFKVTNDAGYELPSTGGSGTTLLYLFGGILILGAGVLLWRRRRLI
ncbi:MAG: VWA domain-containing protein, partial [Clostridia bacterium]|nr:VWA domain-containing protein [Clostridia bacterium]